MTFFATVKTFSFLLLDWPFFLCFFLKSPFPFLKSPIDFLIYFIGMFFGFSLLEISILVIFLIFLGPFSKIVVEARRRRD
jgi:hypothetical protein